MSKSVCIILFLLMVAFVSESQTRTSLDSLSQQQTDSYSDFLTDQQLQEYSKMGDTTITEYGNMDLRCRHFTFGTNYGPCCFAKLEIEIRKGKLSKIHAMDHNTGCELTLIYDEQGKVLKERTRYGSVRVTNAPPYR